MSVFQKAVEKLVEVIGGEKASASVLENRGGYPAYLVRIGSKQFYVTGSGHNLPYAVPTGQFAAFDASTCDAIAEPGTIWDTLRAVVAATAPETAEAVNDGLEGVYYDWQAGERAA